MPILNLLLKYMVKKLRTEKKATKASKLKSKLKIFTL